MKAEKPMWLPQKMLKYQFTCFISLGDLDDNIDYDECEDCESPVQLKLGGTLAFSL